jgi:hypothetical protein
LLHDLAVEPIALGRRGRQPRGAAHRDRLADAGCCVLHAAAIAGAETITMVEGGGLPVRPPRPPKGRPMGMELLPPDPTVTGDAHKWAKQQLAVADPASGPAGIPEGSLATAGGFQRARGGRADPRLLVEGAERGSQPRADRGAVEVRTAHLRRAGA